MDRTVNEIAGQAPGARLEVTSIVICALAMLAFFVLAHLSIDLTRSGGRIAAVWLPNAIAVAVFLRFRFAREKACLAAIFTGNILANLMAGDAASQALLLASANLLEIAVAVGLTRKWCGRDPVMEDIGDLRHFAVAAGVIGPAASGAVALLAFLPAFADLPLTYAKWVSSDTMSMLILAPTVMIAIDTLRRMTMPKTGKLVEWVVLTLGGTTVTLLVFTQTTYPLLFLIPPVVVVHAFRLGSAGTAFSTIKVAMIALVCTELGYGPINLVDYTQGIQLLVLQAFLASSILVGLPISATLSTRQRIATELANQKAELALLAENVTDAILRVNRDGICTYASPSVQAVLGLPPGDFVGRHVSERVHPDAADLIHAAEQRLNSGEAEKERFTYRRYLNDTQDEPVYIEADCAVARDAAGEREGIVVSARDVTHRVLLERQLKRATLHAENAARAKAQFLANMSHEIRTPMNGVLGFAELLQRRDLDEEAARCASLIERSGRSMMMLLNDILDLSKIESGQLKVTSEPVDIAQVTADCVQLHQAEAERKRIDLRLAPGAGIPGTICSDPLRLRQILLNLIGNAVKFTEKGGIEVAVMREQSQLAISVEDTGIGIDTQRLGVIFDPFVQAEGSTTRRFGGTGLGLSISRQLAELLGGSLTVDSMPGFGSRFTLRIPIVEADHDQAPVSTNHTRRATDFPMPARGRILLAEDHDVNRMLVTAMLEDLGQDVTLAHDGIAAIDAAIAAEKAGLAFDLVLMDIQMPGCDGYAATRALRAEGLTAEQLPVIALTANAYPEDVAAAREAGMQAHLAKPLVFEDLAAALARWLPMRIIADAKDGGGRIRRPQSKPQAAKALDERWRQRRSEAIEAVSAAVRSRAMEGTGVEELARTVHKLAGTAGMFGEEELGAKAAALERALRSGVSAQVRLELAEELLEAA